MVKRLSIILITLFGCVGCDQTTKYTAEHFLEGNTTISLFGDFLRLVYAENDGGFLSLGASLPEQIRTTIFLMLVSVILFALLIYIILNKDLDKKTIIAAALIIGGGVGNLIDRIVNNGAVMDFINIGFGSLRTGIFNIADVAIMLGALMIIFFTNKSQA